MYKSNHCAILLRKILGLFVLAIMSTATLADRTLNEVIVTSDFRDTGLLKTAASITVFDRQTIGQRQARHLEQLINLAPNVNFASGASRGRFIQIRGIGERSQFIEPLNPSVGILVDGIDFTGIAGAATTMDMAQIEILRGPQGTLYGANALAGLINLRSNQPSAQTKGRLAISRGEYNTQTVSAALGGPLNDSVGYRFALQQHSSDGYIRNDFLQVDDTDNIDELSVRSILDWQASANLDLKLTIFHVDADNGYDAFSLDNTRQTLSDNPGHDRQQSTAVALQSNWQAHDDFALVSLISFADNDLEYGYDEDWAYGEQLCVDFACAYDDPYNAVDNYLRDRNNGSLDIRLVSPESARIFNGTTDWVAGIYWREQDEELLRQYYGDFTSDFDTTNQAIYGQLDTQLFESLRLSVGLRFENRQATYSDSDLVSHRVDEDTWGGRIALQYQLPSQTMVYGLISRGYKAGGVNSNPSVAEDDREFDTEFMLNYELGAKGRWLNDALQAQIAMFYQQRDDIQIKQTFVEPREIDSGVSFTDYFGNSAKGSNYGIELEFNWLASETLAVFGSLGLLETDFDIPLSQDLDSREQAHAPAYQFSLGARAQISGSLALSIDVEGKDEFYLSSSHGEKSQPYELVNANLTYISGDWALSLWGRNLTDEDVIIRGFNFAGFTGDAYYGNDPRKGWITEPYYQLGAPRIIGLSAKYDF